MKNLFFTLVLSFVSAICNAQYFESGTYIFTSEGGMLVQLEFCDGGWAVCDVKIKDSIQIAWGGEGEWFMDEANIETGNDDPKSGHYDLTSVEGKTYELHWDRGNMYHMTGDLFADLFLIDSEVASSEEQK